MKKLFILVLLSFQCAYGNESLEKYFSYLNQLDCPNGNYRDGEIEIAIDPTEIARIQKVQENRLLKKGFSSADAAEYSRIGIISEDQYWIWLRDAVFFPNGVPGTYDRLLWKYELTYKLAGIAVLPMLPSGQLGLVLNYRHATRSWELELPRGARNPQETIEEAAFRNTKEETGCTVSSITFLGEIALDSGVLSSIRPVFIAKIDSQGNADIEYSEAIAGVLFFTKEELKEGLVKGFLEITVEGKKKQVFLRDAFLTFALFQAECRKLL